MITNQEAIRHLDDVISQYEEVVEKSRANPPDVKADEIYLRLRAAVFRLAPNDSEYEKQARTIDQYRKPASLSRAEDFVAIARSLRRDYQGGFISASFAALVRSDVFADFVEIAEHLLNAGYKDPSAVLVGAVLEEHLRKLCLRHSILTLDSTKPRKTESLNSDLASKNVYSRLDQKSVTAWLDLRNKAAHGHFNEYTDAQVDLMLRGVRDFVSRLPT
jgi:hypothetical protein